MSKLIDLTNKTFERLRVIERAGTYTSPENETAVTWLCECECGNKTVVLGRNLTSGMTKSCGCLRRDFMRNRRKKA